MTGMLRISEATAIAAHAIVALAMNEKISLSGHALAEGMKASQAHLAKVMRRLVKAGLVKSERGPSGGFSLAKSADEISMLDVYEAIEGALPEKGCLFSEQACNRKACPLSLFISKLNNEALAFFKGMSAARLARELKEAK